MCKCFFSEDTKEAMVTNCKQMTSVMLSHFKADGSPRLDGDARSSELKDELEDFFGSAECSSSEEVKSRESSSEEGEAG